MTFILKFLFRNSLLQFTSRLLNRSKMALSGGLDRGSHSMDKSITLPPDEIFRNLENAKRFAIDIGIITRKLALLLFCGSQRSHFSVGVLGRAERGPVSACC